MSTDLGALRQLSEAAGTDVRTGAPQPYPPDSAEAASPSLEHTLAGSSRWAQKGDMYFGVGETHEALPAGVYRCGMSNTGPYMQKQRIAVDDLIVLPDQATEVVLSEFQRFWQLRDKFVERGFLHKRGYFFWGPPGGGKTSAVQLMAARLVQSLNGVVVFIDTPGTASNFLQLLRGIEPERPAVAVLEDLDALVERYGENEYLALLDGEAQIDNVVFVATSNYPERLDRRFLDRPSRFDTLQFVGMPTAASRRAYLLAKEPTIEDAIAQWVDKTDGFSIAHLRELIVAVRIFGQPLDEVVERLDAMHARQPQSTDDPDRPPVGFRRPG